jgi:hypothetical protein
MTFTPLVRSKCGRFAFFLAALAGFPHRALDLLLTLGLQVFAEAAPVENREPNAEMASI